MCLAVAVSYKEVGRNDIRKKICMIHAEFPVSKSDDAVQMIQLHCLITKISSLTLTEFPVDNMGAKAQR